MKIPQREMVVNLGFFLLTAATTTPASNFTLTNLYPNISSSNAKLVAENDSILPKIPTNAWKYSNKSITSFLVRLNNLRSSVQPAASHMHAIKWSKTLALEAVYWAEECSFYHRHPNTLMNQQNDETDFPSTVIGILADAQYDLATDKCESTLRHCNYYRMILRDDINSIGCGTAKCFDKGGETFLTICQLDKGLYNGQPYQTSEKSCQTCPENLPKCINNMCYAMNDTELVETTTKMPSEESKNETDYKNVTVDPDGKVLSLWELGKTYPTALALFFICMALMIFALLVSLWALFSVRKLDRQFTSEGRKF